MKTIINTVQAEAKENKSAIAVKREKTAYSELLDRYGVSDETLSTEQQLKLIYADNMKQQAEHIQQMCAFSGKIAYSALRSKYRKCGIETLNPDRNKDLLSDCQSAILVYLSRLYIRDWDSVSYPVVRACYRACNTYTNSYVQADRKHLYIDSYTTDEEGNETIDIIDVTAQIEQLRIEEDSTFQCYLNELKHLLSDRDVYILKCRAKGYTDETTARALGISRVAVTKRRHKIAEKLSKAGFLDRLKADL